MVYSGVVKLASVRWRGLSEMAAAVVFGIRKYTRKNGALGGRGGVRLKCGDEYEESRGKMWAEKFFLFPAGCIVFRFGACRKLAAWARRLSVRFLSFRDNSFALLLARFVQILLRWASARGPLEASCIRRNFFLFFVPLCSACVCFSPPLLLRLFL